MTEKVVYVDSLIDFNIPHCTSDQLPMWNILWMIGKLKKKKLSSFSKDFRKEKGKNGELEIYHIYI